MYAHLGHFLADGMEFIWTLDTEFVELKKEKQLSNLPFHYKSALYQQDVKLEGI